MDTTSYTYKGKSWRRCPTISDSNNFFHAAFGARTDESGSYLDEHAEFRRMRWATFLTYFKNQKMPSCLADTLRKCLYANEKYQHVSTDVKQHLATYIYDIMTGERAVAKEEIPILSTTENIKVVVLSGGRRDPTAVVEPNPNILGSYPRDVPREKPKEVVVCLEVNVFARLEPVNRGICPESIKNKVERKTDPSKYRKGGSAGSKGVEYQVYLLATVILNAFKNALSQWKLSTENEGAGKFDDIVLELSEGAVLIQSKHKESNKKITLEELTSTNSKNDDFSLPKYFLSYMSIKEKFNVKNVIICTNAGVSQKALDFLDRQGENSESLLHYEDGDCSFYTLKDTFLPGLIETTVSYYRLNFKDKGMEESVITEENLKDFSKHLQIYFNYPSLKTLEKNIEKLLSLTKCCGNSQGKITSLEMFSKVMAWFQQKKGLCEYFTELHTKAMFAEIWTDKYCQKLERYKVSLHKNDLNFQGPKQIFRVAVAHGHLLQAIKIYHAVQKDKEKILFTNSDDDAQELALQAFELPKYVFLIVILLEVKEESVIMDMWDKLRDVLDKNKYKKVIFINESNDTFFSHIGPCYEPVDGSVTFQDLSTVSQERLSKKKNIVFQGRSVCLEELLAARTTEDCLRAVDAETLEKMIAGEEVKVGMRPLDLDENIARFYINRTFKRTNEEIDEHNIYEVKEDVVLLSDSAGMGKSTVLSKLATTIKNRNAHLWVIKIALTEYTGILRDALTNHRETVNVVELLNSKKSTKLTNNLERFVFSMDKRVVLMLDGIDEISPDYTELVLSLLARCLQAVNFAKVFVTTRPHMVRKLEKFLRVAPFVLHPFTQQNQVNFLTSYWGHNLNIDGENVGRCERYARTLMNKMSSWTKRHRFDHEVDFTAIPQQLKMLAKIFQEGIKQSGPSDWEGCREYLRGTTVEPKLPEKMDIKELYEMFIKRKRDIYVHKGNPSGNTAANGALIKQFYDTLNYHKILALEVILSEQDCRHFSHYKQGYDGIDENSLKIGIVQKSSSGVHFIHRTFAEYFVAEGLVHELQLQLQNPNVDFQEFFIETALHSPEYQIIRSFLDSFLRKILNSVPSDIFEAYQSRDSNNLSMEFDTCLHSLAKEGCVTLLRLILKCVKFKAVPDGNYSGGSFTGIFSAQDDTQKLELVNLMIKEKVAINSLNAIETLLQSVGIDIRNMMGRTPLLEATRHGQLETVKFLVGLGAKTDIVDNNGQTAVHFAAEIGHLEIIDVLLERGADFNAVDNRKRTAVHLAAWDGHSDTVKLLLELGVSVNVRDGDSNTPLHLAASNGRSDTVKLLLELGADFRTRNNDGRTPLHLAASYDQFDIVKYLLRLGADLNTTNNDGRTALHFATKHNRLNSVKSLYELGIDLNIRDDGGRSALHYAASNGHWDAVKYLLELGADFNARDNKGLTALHHAAWEGHIDTIKLLSELGADLYTRDNEGLTALHFAAENGHLDAVKCLLELGVHISVSDSDGSTILHTASRGGQLAVVEYLVNLNTDVNFKDGNGRTALHFAAWNGHLDIVNLLLEMGADFNVRDTDGLTELHVATLNGKFDTARFLLELGADFFIEDDGSTPLHLAAANGHLDTVKCLLKLAETFNAGGFDTEEDDQISTVVESLAEACGDVNIKDSDGRTPLHFAVSKGRLDTVKFLLEHGADLTARDNDGLTALHLVAGNGQLDAVKFLVERGLYFHVGDRDDSTPLQLAAMMGQLAVVEYLGKLGEDVGYKDNNGRTALHFAAWSGHLDVIGFLLEMGADFNVRDKDGLTALHVALANSRFDTARFLLERGGDLYVEDDDGSTPLHLAAANGHLDIINCLLKLAEDFNAGNLLMEGQLLTVMESLVEACGDVNFQDSSGRTPLHFAASKGRLDIVKFLHEMGADPSIKDKDDNTALQLALHKGYHQIADYFENNVEK